MGKHFIFTKSARSYHTYKNCGLSFVQIFFPVSLLLHNMFNSILELRKLILDQYFSIIDEPIFRCGRNLHTPLSITGLYIIYDINFHNFKSSHNFMKSVAEEKLRGRDVFNFETVKLIF